MTKKYILFTITILISLRINAQIDFIIKKIQVSNTNAQISNDIIREGEDDGPFVTIFFSFKNNTDSILKLHPSKSEMIIQFQYKNRYNSQDGFPIPFMDNDSLIILPHQQYESFVGVNLFLGTFIFHEKNNDYRIELIEVLPTMKLFYKEKKIRIKTNEILDVEVIDKNTDNVKHEK